MGTDCTVLIDTLNEDINKWNSKISAYSCLEKFTDELGNDAYITGFVSTGPKPYSYKTNNGKKGHCKVLNRITKNSSNLLLTRERLIGRI